MNATRSDIVREKKYPSDYSSEAVDILDNMTIGNDISLVGSMALRSQQYAGDFDAYEVVKKTGSKTKALKELREKFQSNIKALRAMPNVFIGDIKAGVVDEWRVIPRNAIVRGEKIENYNAVQSRAIVDRLVENNIITRQEAKECYGLLKDNPTVPQFLEAKQKIKFHIIRWKVSEVLLNKKRLRDGRIITLEEAFSSPGITKLDVVALIDNRYTDFSCIYQFRLGKTILNPEPLNIKISLEESITALLSEGNFFKVLKRMFALAKLLNDTKMLNELNPVLNSDLGRLYQVVSDIDTLLYMLEEYSTLPVDTMKDEIDNFKTRLSNIYTLNDYIKKDDSIVGSIDRILQSVAGRKQLTTALEKLRKVLDDILQANAKKIVMKFYG
jgi:hypothetical protein